MRRLLLLVCLVLGLTNAMAQKPEQRCVYMFGFAASFVDSTAYITDIQTIDSAFVFKKNGFLADRSLYSMQLSQFLQVSMQKENMTCAVFFDLKKSKLEKTFLKVRKKYSNDPGVLLTPLGKDVFTFKAEEWFDPTAIETSNLPEEEASTEVAEEKEVSTEVVEGEEATTEVVEEVVEEVADEVPADSGTDEAGEVEEVETVEVGLTED